MSEMQSTDVALLEKARRGDRLAFKALVVRNQQSVRTTVFAMLGDTAEVDDVAQEVFIRFFKSFRNFRGEAKLSTYLTRIAINLSLNELKKRQRKSARVVSLFKKNVQGEENVLEVPDNSMSPTRFDTEEAISRALQRLSPEFRVIVVLRLVEGYSVAETANVLGLPTGTIASRLARAQKKLRKIMEEWEKTPETDRTLNY